MATTLRSIPLSRWAAPLVIALLVLAAGVTMLTHDDGDMTLTAHFPRTISIYEAATYGSSACRSARSTR